MMVQFNMQSCEVHDIEHLNDCTDEQVAAKWLTTTDWKEIRDGNNQIGEHLLLPAGAGGRGGAEKTPPQNDETTATAGSLRRGLECFLPEMANEKSQKIKDSIHSVLVEQIRQCTDGVQDNMNLADIYRN